MNEQISCVFPFVSPAGNSSQGISPVLTFDCETIPVKASIDIAFYFICLKNKVTYTLWFDISHDGKSIINDDWDRLKSFNAEDPNSKPEEIAVGLNANMPHVPFNSEGIYTIEARLFPDESNEPIATHKAYFKVKLKAGGSK